MASRIPYLTELIPKSGLLFWYSLDEPDEGVPGSIANNVSDESGNNLTLVAEDNQPVWRELATEEKYIEFDGTNDPLVNDGGSFTSVNLKHLFIIAAFRDATFDDTNGLITEVTSANGMLVGETGTNRFFNFSLPSTVYTKSGANYAAANMVAPVSNIPELIEFQYPTGFDLTTLQIGKDRDFTGRLWDGRFDAAVGFSRVLTTLEISRLRLYANLRSRLWIALGQTLTFPSPEIILDGKPTYSRFYSEPLNDDEITYSHVYDDGRKTFNTLNILPPRRWQIELNGISAEKAQVCDAFKENVQKHRTFNFYDYKRGRTYSGVRIENYSREHDGHKSWSNNCRFELVKY